MIGSPTSAGAFPYGGASTGRVEVVNGRLRHLRGMPGHAEAPTFMRSSIARGMKTICLRAPAQVTYCSASHRMTRSLTSGDPSRVPTNHPRAARADTT